MSMSPLRLIVRLGSEDDALLVMCGEVLLALLVDRNIRTP